MAAKSPSIISFPPPREDLLEAPDWGAEDEVLQRAVGLRNVRVISSPGSGGVSQGDPEANSSGASSGPPSPVDARVLRDLEVMKADHDLDTAVTEGSLAMIRGRYSILVDALEAGL
ncbi:hypothetical protein BHE74_00038997 [Ensete ventricosum]|nr:hypothetical protein BHE74_00038997 [Ensete ventricosum]